MALFYIAKIRMGDLPKVEEAIALVEGHASFSLLTKGS
ncbi:hypothetical protein PARA125_001194 [Parachlamydia sp. AcF125]|nr:hypothetical protein [Parachlamydia sp. AcF125]